VRRATELHRFYGPSVAWFEEIRRYEYLLGFDEQGRLGRRLPVLLTMAVVFCAGLLLARGARHLPGMRFAPVPIGCLVAGLALLWLTPSKWTHYFGGLAGVGAAAMTAGIVLIAVAARGCCDHRTVQAVAGVGTLSVIMAASLGFAGKNTWFLFSHYGVPRDDAPFSPLDSPLLWAGFAAAVLIVLLLRKESLPWAVSILPVAVSVTATAITLVVLVTSFVLAPIRQGEATRKAGKAWTNSGTGTPAGSWTGW
jgi:arabinosyltransferase C